MITEVEDKLDVLGVNVVSALLLIVGYHDPYMVHGNKNSYMLFDVKCKCLSKIKKTEKFNRKYIHIKVCNL